MLKDAKPVSVEVLNATIEEVMSMCLKGQPFKFTISGNSVIVKPVVSLSDHLRPVLEIPQNEISGRVTNTSGEPLSGASVVVKRTGKGIQTDTKGQFTIKNVNSDDILTISFTGYKSFDFKVADRSSITIILEVAADQLDETIIQAYGTTTRRLSTGNIAKVSAVEIERQPVMNPLLALQGKVAGTQYHANKWLRYRPC